ncbi:Glycogenin-1 [Hordeum vulgare]|uniref:Glucuronosyltransferase PGSIP8 n=2 Tax=Hordeum vulgare subsp. vulgare TaxID=112509 RepID=A0A8I6WJ59_HORVV|nr:putative glucuronosyltransferase PGSIP7 [Hordeum vulgare subsp. vulgare]KAE8796755.1 Glycogenin-1 [Hordeum vulgare]
MDRRLAAAVAVAAAILWLVVASASASLAGAAAEEHGQRGVAVRQGQGRHRHAYAAMMYMGTPRDYEFYVAVRVMMRSLSRVGADADRVLIASSDVPRDWVRAMREEDGMRVVVVENLKNPYEGNLGGMNRRFKLTLNKLYAWSLVEYERVVMIDSDNIFLQNTDELFQCGQFCAVFINPCYFHTGLFVLQPSRDVFNGMLHDLEIGRDNSDGADQGFLVGCFPDLLDKPLFHPPENGTKLNGTYRLPLGYQMDASYYYLKLHWHVPCGPNSVITFPSAPWFKPWYWWSWPILPLGLSWHKQRWDDLGYAAEIPVVLMELLMYIGIIALTRLARPQMTKLCYNRRPEKQGALVQWLIKLAGFVAMMAAYTIPFFVIPCTIHPIMGWSMYLFGVLAFSMVVINAFLLPPLAVLTAWLGIVGMLFVMAFPWYHDGIARILVVVAYAFCSAPFLWASMVRVMDSLQTMLERDPHFPRLGDPAPETEFSKLY